ncbi:MAG: MATE family efflux transporter [Oscillospiraceae bacterium]|nr:MATE family efflux transporter [Oscillospiraceae bacterium]
MSKNLTEGKPWSLIWRFTLPLLISVIFQQLYTIADSIVAGQFVGETVEDGIRAVAALGVSSPIIMLFIQVANGINAGCAVVISQLFGGGKHVKLKTAITTSIIATVILAAALTIVGFLTSKPLLRLMNTPENVYNDATVYLNIYIAGLIFLFVYNVCTGIFTAMGDSKTPLFFLMASSVANVLLNLVMVIPLQMGVAGLAWATFIAQGISALIVVAVLYFRVKGIKTRHRGPRFSTSMLKTINRVALPTIAQLSFVSVGGLFVQNLINEMGEAAAAGFAASLRVCILGVACMFCPSNAFSAFSAQNIGAGKIERIPTGFKAGFALSAIIILPFVIAFTLFPDFIMGFFIKSGDAPPELLEETLSVGRMFLRFCSPFYFALAVKVMCDAVLRGGGALRPFVIATFVDLFLRVILSYALVPFIGFMGICVGWATGWVVSALMVFFFYKKGVWKDTAFSRRLIKR